MSRFLFLVLSILLLPTVFGAGTGMSGGKGKSLGSVADSGHGSTGGGGGGSSTGRHMYVDPRKAPPLDESRKVSVQDCSKPVDLQAGNLRCK